MLRDPIQKDIGAQSTSAKAALEKLAKISQEFSGRDDQAKIADLLARELRYETALDKISQGVCFFDGEQRLILSNRRYAEIYRLKPEEVSPGTSLLEITERRAAVGTVPMAVGDYLTWCASINAGTEARTWTAELKNGRTIRVCHQPMPDGGWVATHEDVTELNEQRAVVDELISLQTLIDWVPDYLWVKDMESRFVVANKALAADCGRPSPRDMIGLSDQDFHAPELAKQFRQSELNILRTGQPMIDNEESVVNAAGAVKWLLSTKVPLRNERDEIFGLVGIARDITERKKADVLRIGQAQVLEMIAMSAPLEGVLEHLVLLVEGQLVGITCSILMLEKDEIHLRHVAAPNLPKSFTNAIDGVAIGPDVGSCGTAVYRKEVVIVSDIENDPLWKDYRGLAAEHGYKSCWSTPILSYQGTVLGTFAMYSKTVREPTVAETAIIDVATRIAGIAIERKKAEDRIHFMANHDALTKLPNRTLLKDRLSQALLYTQRHDSWVTVVFIDLDNFKIVNDSLGHNAGDTLLKAVASRMTNSVRSSDTVVRLGGDEFVILLLDQPKDVDVISSTLQKIRAAIAAPIHIEGHNLKVTASIGIANFPNDGTDADTLLANADAAMYRAKEMGRDNFQFYTPELNVKVHEKFLLQEELRNAVARSEFILLYQPQVDLRTGRIFAVEALVRWSHPTQGMVSPAKFIPAAEETGLIVPIGDWVLHEACRQNKAWQDVGLPRMNVCVNVSARQFREKNLVARVIHALHESKLDAKYLELELTESLIMQDVERAVKTMEELEALGVQISIDDFGTGYSSLSALKNFPVARLKIDKSFINDLMTNENDKAVASAVISLGQKLNLRVIAEGVETAEQVAFLRKNNCDEIQGFHFSKPIGSEAVADFLKSHQGAAPPR